LGHPENEKQMVQPLLDTILNVTKKKQKKTLTEDILDNRLEQ
jgi:hypothetical protein